MSECCMTRSESDTNGLIWKVAELIEQAHKNGYKAGYSKAENDYHAKTEEDRQSSYELGLNMAWEAAGKLVSMDYKECNKVLGDGVLTVETVDEIFIRHTAFEAIDKLRAYEEQKKQEDEIHVGDEVTIDGGRKMIVLGVDCGGWYHLLSSAGLTYDQICSSDIKKTGKHYDEIAQVLAKMKEGEE